jgi:hypothetical protein
MSAASNHHTALDLSKTSATGPGNGELGTANGELFGTSVMRFRKTWKSPLGYDYVY